MKKQVAILFCIIINCSSWSQPIVKTHTPCNDEVLFKTSGRWLRKELNDLGSKELGLKPPQIKEITNRMEAVHQLMYSIYPEPLGIDAVWHPSISYSTFAEQLKYSRNNQHILVWDAIVEKPVVSYGYTSGYFRYFCNPNNSNEINRGYPGETGTWLDVYANDLKRIASEVYTSSEMADTMTIDGRPVRCLQPPIKELGNFVLRGIDYETAILSTHGIERSVLIHRKGMLPYIPVTRKQYLDRCIPLIRRWFDDGLKTLKAAPLPYNDKENQEIRANQIETAIKQRDAVLKRFQDEAEKNIKDGTLGMPAIVIAAFSPLINDGPIFVEEKQGLMLIIENPNYKRNDLPKTVPQFFLVQWRWSEWKPQADLAKLIEERFPFDKLEAMIDK